MTTTNIKNQLLKLLVEKSFNYSKDPVFTLQSGRKSQFYINCKTTSLNPEGMAHIGELLFEHFIRNKGIQAVGGLTLGADPLAFAVAMYSYTQKAPVRPFVIRKNAKGHGLKKWIEGEFFQGERVAILDDVVTTGESTINAIQRARESGLLVEFAVCLVDREEGGRENIEREKTSLYSLFTKKDLLDYYENSSPHTSS